MSNASPLHHVVIDAVDRRGHGWASVDGHRLRVPGTDAGEIVELRVAEGRRGRLVGRVQAVLEPSPHRVDPGCAQQPDCPGCPLRHLSPQRAQMLRRDGAVATLRRFAAVEVPDAPTVHAPIGRDGFRARAVAMTRRGTDGTLVLGMDAYPSPDGPSPPIDLARCPVQTDDVRDLLARLTHELDAAGYTIFDPQTREGALRHVVVQRDRVVLGFATPPDTDRLIREVLPDRADVGLFYEVVRPDRFGVLVKPIWLRGPRFSALDLDGDRFRATLPAWTPQSPTTIPSLRRVVRAALDIGTDDDVLELGSGIGTLSIDLARAARSVLGVDMVYAAVEDSEHNAARAGIENATFRNGRAHRAARRLLSREPPARFDLALLHAMRLPFGDALMGVLPALRARRLVYLAPSTAALAADISALPRHRLVDLSFFDQMPGTAHLLAIATLEPDVKSA